jgi:hypothetical protein
MNKPENMVEAALSQTLDEARELGLHFCVFDPGSAGDPCHAPEPPHYRRLTNEEVIAVLKLEKKVDKYGRLS